MMSLKEYQVDNFVDVLNRAQNRSDKIVLIDEFYRSGDITLGEIIKYINILHSTNKKYRKLLDEKLWEEKF